MSDNLPKAYQYADDKLHHICAWCPDKEEAERLAHAVEMKKWIESMHTGVSEYVKRKISHVICDPCSQKQKQS
ncbi:hypothetical protein COW46_00725 [Candidatus Gracilibacteria bacterium CG17_big_fil_post_rev_8_21_14_2_50_48_13]|nr:MAG: hypothetical protein COW46_00725 [Candidatus Gracilibacteria bacterium CG17_big_fil_post_rev_8_21_14_2_50_48_13]